MRLPRPLLRGLIALCAIIGTGLLLPESAIVPVDGASAADWNQDSFWYEPWGVSGVHKGVDIFAAKGRPVIAATGGLVVYRGTVRRGGRIVLILGPKWRFHYYAHLEAIDESAGRFVRRGDIIGTVGDSGNAAGKAPHLHYTILALLPHPWYYTGETQGWKRMFYLDPTRRF